MKRRLIILGGIAVLLAAAAGLLWWSVSAGEEEGEPAEASAEQPADFEPTTPTIAGEVVDSTGLPVNGATVETADGATATTGRDGRFEITGLEPGVHKLDARASGYVAAGPRGMRRVEVRLADGEETPRVDGIRLVLRRPATLTGRVVAAGRPVEGAALGLYYMHADGLTGPLEPFALDEVAATDAQGRFTLEKVAPGRLQILAEAADYALAESKELYLEPGEELSGIVIDLAPSARVVGEVVDTDGQPVSAELVLRGPTRSRRIEAGSDGRFAFDNVAAGTYVIEASAPGYRTELIEQVEVASDEKTTRDVVMEAASGIFGRVVDPSGQGVAEAFVWLTSPQNPRARKLLRTNADGRFQWPEPQLDSYEARAISPRHASSRPRLVRSGQETQFELGEGGAVAGRVVGPDGRPVQSFSVGVESIETDGLRPYRPTAAGVKEVNDSAGRFRFESLRPGKYWFRVQTARYAAATSEPVVVRPGREFSGLTIRVGRSGRIMGRVTNAETGEPVAGASVSLFDPTSPFAANRTRTDSQGRYEIDGASPGRRSLRVSKKNYLSTVSAGVDVAPGGQAIRDVALREQKPGERMQFHGIGAVLTKNDDGIQVRKVMEGHPAAEFGMQDGDIIRSVDRESVDGMHLGQVIEKIRGQQGVPVELEVDREGEGRFTLQIERGRVVVK